MPYYIDFHEKLKAKPQLAPARVKDLMIAIRGKEFDEFGVRHLNFFSGKIGHGFCVCEAPSVEALLKSHEALGLPLEAKDAHEIDFTLAEQVSEQ